MVFLNRRSVQVDICGGVYFLHCEQIKEQYFIFVYQAKRKQALLESNLPGMCLKVDENVNSKGYHHDSPLIFLETTMP